MRQARWGMAPKGDKLGRDRDRNLFGSDGSDVEAHGGMYTVKPMGGNAFLLQRLENLDDLALRSDHPDIARPCLDRPAQDAHIVTVPTGNDDDIGRFIGIELLRGVVEIEGVDFAS